VPTGFQAMRQEIARQRLADTHQPVVAKGVHGSKGKYVFRLDDPAEELERIDDDLVGFFTFQQYLEVEREYRVLVLDGQPLGAISKQPAKGDFRRNFSLGGQVEAAELNADLREICRQAAQTLGYQFAGVDLAISHGRPYILEVNRSPGFAGFEEATGQNVAAAFLKMVAGQPAEPRKK
jgi:glutathione synthase/RimK-type ligase-like ATP-grasp enzyme